MKNGERIYPAAAPIKVSPCRRDMLIKGLAFSLLSLTLVAPSLSASTRPTIRIIVVKNVAEAEKIRAEIDRGTPFALLAKDKSVDKSRENYGEIEKSEFDTLDTRLKDAAYGLREGGVSDVIALGDNGYALVLVVDMTSYKNGARAFRTGDYRAAETHLLKHCELNPDAVKARIMLGRIYESRKEYDTAEKNYTEALRFNPHAEEAYELLGALYLRRGEISQAKNIYAEGLRNLPASVALKEGAEKTAKRGIRNDARTTAAETSEHRRPAASKPEVKLPSAGSSKTELPGTADNRKLHLRIIVTRSESDAKSVLADLKRGKSMALLAKERSIDENTKDAYGYLGEVAVSTLHSALQRPLLALKEGQTSGIIRMAPGRYAIAQITNISLYKEGEKALIEGDSKTAEKKLRAYIESNPDAVKARTLLGKIYEDRNEFSKAIEMYRKAISFSPKTVLVYERLARDYLLLGDYKKAKEVYTEGLKQVPSSPEMEEGVEMADMLLIGEGNRMP